MVSYPRSLSSRHFMTSTRPSFWTFYQLCRRTRQIPVALDLFRWEGNDFREFEYPEIERWNLKMKSGSSENSFTSALFLVYICIYVYIYVYVYIYGVTFHISARVVPAFAAYTPCKLVLCLFPKVVGPTKGLMVYSPWVHDQFDLATEVDKLSSLRATTFSWTALFGRGEAVVCWMYPWYIQILVSPWLRQEGSERQSLR